MTKTEEEVQHEANELNNTCDTIINIWHSNIIFFLKFGPNVTMEMGV